MNKEVATKEIDVIGLIRKVAKEWKTLLLFVSIAAVIGLIVAFTMPKEYTSKVVLAPEVTAAVFRVYGEKPGHFGIAAAVRRRRGQKGSPELPCQSSAGHPLPALSGNGAKGGGEPELGALLRPEAQLHRVPHLEKSLHHLPPPVRWEAAVDELDEKIGQFPSLSIRRIPGYLR